MRKTFKQKKIYSLLRDRIVGGQYPAGSKLPVEKEFCRLLGVARITLREALACLESEALVERIPRIGTFVRKHRPVLTFQLSCADFLTMDIASAEIDRMYMNGMLKTAFENGAHVETVAVSPTNDPEDIQVSSMQHLNSSSRVLVSSIWSRRSFDMLGKTGAKVCVIDHQDFLEEEYSRYISGWQWLRLNRRSAVKQCVETLAGAGKKRIALVAGFLKSVPHHPVLEAYREAVAKAGLPEIVVEKNENAVPLLEKLRKSAGFDALILSFGSETCHFPGSVNEYLRLPETLPIILFTCLEKYVRFGIPPARVAFPYKEIGMRAAEMLLEEPRGHEETWEPEFIHFENIFQKEGIVQ